MLDRDVCPGCGFEGGLKACADTFRDVSLRVRALAWTDSLKTWRLMHDVYAVQHPTEFCPGYPALIVHLGGLGWALEHDAEERGYRALAQLATQAVWQRAPFPPEPGLPERRGAVLVSSLSMLHDPSLLVAGIDRWARATWLAYAPLHATVREWLQQAAQLAGERH
jgi:hypothetical protein